MLDTVINARREKWMTHYFWWSEVQVPMEEITQMISCVHEVLPYRNIQLHREGPRTWREIQIHLEMKLTDMVGKAWIKGTTNTNQESLVEHDTLRKLTNAWYGAIIKGQNARLAQKWMDLYSELESGLMQWDESIRETFKGIRQEIKSFFWENYLEGIWRMNLWGKTR